MARETYDSGYRPIRNPQFTVNRIEKISEDLY